MLNIESFYNLQNPFVQDIQSAYPNIRNEFKQAVSKNYYIGWPEKFLYNEGWNVFGLRYQGTDFSDAHKMCPFLSGIILKHSALIFSAGFSILEPGTIIKPHVGYTSEVLRVHLGIQVPLGDCALKVNGITSNWQEGEILIFDDTLEHEAWNKTESSRIILLIDVYKKLIL